MIAGAPSHRLFNYFDLRLVTTRSRYSIAAAILALSMLPTVASSFQVLPRISDVDRELTSLGSNKYLDGLGQWFMGNAVPMLKSPVHEAIALNALDCDAPAGSEPSCITIDAVQRYQVLLYGVRWPDDPPFALSRTSPPRISGCDPKVTLRSTAQPKCWWGLFSDADKTAKQRMISKPGEPAFGPGDYLLYRSHFGVLLHMLQDSFSQAHAGRNPETGISCEAIPRFAQPGKISQFYSYAGQVGSLHDHEDTFQALGLQTLQTSPNVVDASRAFLTLWQEGAPWVEAEKYFDCAFAIEDPNVEAGPGPFVK